MQVTIGDDTELAGLRLVIDPMQTLAGRVTSGNTPVIGARISAYALGTSLSERMQTTTDLDGSFRVSIAGEAKRALVLVAAPTRVLQAFEIDVSRPLVLNIASSGGMLTARVPASVRGFDLRQNGIPVPSIDLFPWALGHGESAKAPEFRLPNLAPGHYRLCVPVPPPGEKGTPVLRCGETSLAAGSTASIDLTK